MPHNYPAVPMTTNTASPGCVQLEDAGRVYHMRYFKRYDIVVLSVIIGSLSLSSAKAQTVPASIPLDAIYFGYSGNIPGQILGVSCSRIASGIWGLYIDFKFTHGIPNNESPDYYDHISVVLAESWGDHLRKDRDSYMTLNAGITRRVGNGFAVYGALGVCSYQNYLQYYDPMHILGTDGEYWIDGTKSSLGLNFMVGGYIPASDKVLIQIGVETYPPGATIGISFGIPR